MNWIPDNDSLDDIIATRGIPLEKRSKFKKAVIASLKNYYKISSKINFEDFNNNIESLFDKTKAALNNEELPISKVIAKIQSLPDEVIQHLSEGVNELPTAEQLKLANAIEKRVLLELIYGLCSSGAIIKEKKRGDKTGKVLQRSLRFKKRKRGRPTNVNEIILCSGIGFAYERATGKRPVRNKYKGSDNEPFRDLLKCILKGAGLEVNVDWLLISYEKSMREHK